MKALFIGFGHVGQKIAEILFLEREKFPGLSSIDLSITGLFTKSKGSLTDPCSVNIPVALHKIRQNGYFSKKDPNYTDQSPIQAIRKSDYDILVELSTLSIKDRGEPAVSYIREALDLGKHVVTANKGPVAFAYDELMTIAKHNNVCFRFESTVMDGTPVFNLSEHNLKGCRITGITGILNSTTNYILSRMEEGEPFQSALAFAQNEGFSEADPANDIEGWDAAAKIAALANVFMNANITPYDVDRKGISNVTPNRIKNALKNSSKIKLICKAWFEGKQVHTSVRPEEIPFGDPFSTINGAGACLRIETDLMNPVLILQESSTLYDTAFGVIEDILTIERENFSDISEYNL